MTTSLLQQALALHAHTKDPLLLDAVRVMTSRNQPPRLVEFARNTVTSCLEAWFVLYGTYDIPLPNNDEA